MGILDIDIVKGFMRMCNDGWLQGWHERNGGNLTYRMKEEEVVFLFLYKTLPDIIFAAFQKQDLDQRSSLFLVTIKTCRDNLGIIDHKAVSLMQVIQYIGKMTMFNTSIFQGQMHQSGRASVLQRILSDQFLRQIIIKI